MTNIKPLNIIKKYYEEDSDAYKYLVDHSKKVTNKAIKIANNLVKNHNMILDLDFIKEAAMLHDIGIKFCKAPKIGCNGREAYVKHGILGSRLLKKEGLMKHAFVCERHIGSGISKKDIIDNNLGLPKKSYKPTCIEEKIICLADKFYSKDPDFDKDLSLNEIRKKLKRFGPDSVKRFDQLLVDLHYDSK